MNLFLISLILIDFSFIYCENLSFQENLFKNILKKEKDKNILISPFSIYEILTLTTNGAVNETQKEMLEVLVPYKKIENKTLESLNSNLINIIKNFSNKKENIFSENIINYDNHSDEENNFIFENSNAIFVNKTLKILDEFSLICDKYKTETFKLESVEQVNNWVNEKTHEKIKTILPENYDISNSVLLLINAIYFKGSWVYKFNEKTNKKQFKNFDNTVIEVETMFNFLTKAKYYEDEKIQMISLPYNSSSSSLFEMTIILPREDKYSSSYDYLEKENVNFTNLKSKLSFGINEVELNLPKFDFEYFNNLNEILKEMGMQNPFSNLANFNKLTDQKIKLDNVFHKTYIKIDQNGTEAAAATLIDIQIVITNHQDYQKKRYYMNVNHSFIFFITNDNIKDSDGNNLILFLGSVNNLKPSNSQKNENININNNNENNEKFDDEIMNKILMLIIMIIIII